jgi:hypothetical protein
VDLKIKNTMVKVNYSIEPINSLSDIRANS